MHPTTLDATYTFLINLSLVTLVYVQLRLIRAMKCDYYKSWVYRLIKWSILIATGLVIMIYIVTLWFY